MLDQQLVLGTVMNIVAVVFHVTVFVGLSRFLRRLETALWRIPRGLFIGITMVTAVLVILLTHTAEAIAWAVLYRGVGELESFYQALYFSVVTSTTLGYGDITLSERWQLLATFEAMGGMILFGASTAFLMQAMQHLFASDMPGPHRRIEPTLPGNAPPMTTAI
ncbi:MAG: potassium channel family protein, partial [Acidobacteriota bacterium]